MSKYETRTTTAIAAIIDFSANKMELIQCVIPYTRAFDKAQKLVAETLEVSPNAVAIRELVQSEFKANDIKASEIVNISHEYGMEEPPAADTIPNGMVAVPYTLYYYYGVAFGYSNDDESPVAYATYTASYDTLTKNDAKALLIDCAKREYNMDVFTLDYKMKTKKKLYAIVDSEKYHALRYSK